MLTGLAILGAAFLQLLIVETKRCKYCTNVYKQWTNDWHLFGSKFPFGEGLHFHSLQTYPSVADVQTMAYDVKT